MKKRAPTEHEIQAAIVDALRMAGFVVYETTAYRQKGASGVDKGIPDLLVAHDIQPGVYFGIEVKKDEKAPYSSHEQAFAAANQRFVTVWTVDMALCAVSGWVTDLHFRIGPVGTPRQNLRDNLRVRIEAVRYACCLQEPA